MRRMFPLAALMVALAAPIVPPAVAENCLERVRELAAAHRVSTDPPTAAPGETRRPNSPDDLARSGGVVEPPPLSDRSVITPPRDHSGMPTLPDVKPSTRPGPAPADGLDAADRSAFQAVLVAARAQAERGEEAACLEGLRKSQALVARRRP